MAIFDVNPIFFTDVHDLALYIAILNMVQIIFLGVMAVDLSQQKILLTGGAGFLGRSVYKKLIEHGASTKNITVPRSADNDLRIRANCDQLVANQDIVIHLAAKVGGLWFHVGRQAEFFMENAMMGLNLIDSSYRAGVKKFVGLGSVCEYPDQAPIPFNEADLWNGYPSKITSPYGLSKRMLLVAGQAYQAQYNWNAIHLLMINLYGPGDDFDPRSSHAIPSLIRRVYESQQQGKNYIEVWGDGSASREFLFVDDAAQGIVLATKHYDKAEPVNLGAGREIPIKYLAETICQMMEFKGEIRWDLSKVGGQLRRQLDVSKAQNEFHFTAMTQFEEGLRQTIQWFLNWQKTGKK